MPKRDTLILCFKLVSGEPKVGVNIRKEIDCVNMGSLGTCKSFSLLSKSPVFWRPQVNEYQYLLLLVTITETRSRIKACRNSQHRDSDNLTGERKMKSSVCQFCSNRVIVVHC